MYINPFQTNGIFQEVNIQYKVRMDFLSHPHTNNGFFFLLTFLHQHSASLMMPNVDPRDGFFYPTLTLMIVLIICVVLIQN